MFWVDAGIMFFEKDIIFLLFFEGMPASRACPLRGRAPRAGPPRVSRKTFGGKSIPKNDTLFFKKKHGFVKKRFFLTECLETCLVRQISKS